MCPLLSSLGGSTDEIDARTLRIANTGDTAMLSRIKMALAAALVLGSASASFAQTIVPEYDGDANPIRGYYDVLAPLHASSIEHSFAAQRPAVTAVVNQYDCLGGVDSSGVPCS
jgi:hypothetical protein